MEFDVENILHSLGLRFELAGKPHRTIRNVAALHSATVDDLAFCSATGTTGIAVMGNSNAGVIFCHTSLKALVEQKDNHQTLYFLEDRHFSVYVNRQECKDRRRMLYRHICDDRPKLFNRRCDCYSR